MGMAVENVGKARRFPRDFSKRRWKSAPFADFHGCGIFHGPQRDSSTKSQCHPPGFLAEVTH